MDDKEVTVLVFSTSHLLSVESGDNLKSTFKVNQRCVRTCTDILPGLPLHMGSMTRPVELPGCGGRPDLPLTRRGDSTTYNALSTVSTEYLSTLRI